MNKRKLFIIFLSFSIITNTVTVETRSQARAKKRTRTFSDYYSDAQEWVEENQDGAFNGAIGMAAVAGGGYWLYYLRQRKKPRKKRHSDFHDEPSNYHHCNEQETRQFNSVTIEQIPVKDQFDSDAGGSASCGYHSILNAKEICDAIKRGRVVRFIRACLKQIEWLFGDDGVWRNQIRDRRGEPTEGDWLSGIEIDYLMKENNDLGAYPHTTLDDIKQVKNSAVFECDIAPVKKAMQDALQAGRDYLHQFFMGTMEQYAGPNDEIRTTQGHWFTVVLHQDKNGKRKYVIAESLGNRSRINDDLVETLINALEK